MPCFLAKPSRFVQPFRSWLTFFISYADFILLSRGSSTMGKLLRKCLLTL